MERKQTNLMMTETNRQKMKELKNEMNESTMSDVVNKLVEEKYEQEVEDLDEYHPWGTHELSMDDAINLARDGIPLNPAHVDFKQNKSLRDKSVVIAAIIAAHPPDMRDLDLGFDDNIKNWWVKFTGANQAETGSKMVKSDLRNTTWIAPQTMDRAEELYDERKPVHKYWMDRGENDE